MIFIVTIIPLMVVCFVIYSITKKNKRLIYISSILLFIVMFALFLLIKRMASIQC